MKKLWLILLIVSCKSYTPLAESTIQRLSECPISLQEAKRNLLQRGYAIEFSGDDYFTTDYRRSDFEDVRSALSQETIREFHRKFTVFRQGERTIKFHFKYRIVERDMLSFSLQNPHYHFENLSTYEKIQKEVCGLHKAAESDQADKA